MKAFENKQTSITIGIAGTQDTKDMTYAELAKLTLDIPPANGWDKNAEMEKILEMSNQPWQFKHKDLLMYMEDIETWNKE
jgi:hypothetical protein